MRVELLEKETLLRVELPKILTAAAMDELCAVLREERRHVRLIVLQGAGGNFSYGASVEEHRREQAPEMLRTLSRLVRAVRSAHAPVAAFVEGKCLGGGFELALACHLIFAAPGAEFGCPEIKLGVFPPVLVALGPRRIGGALTDRLVLTGGVTDGASFATPLGSFDELLSWYRATLSRSSAQALRTAVSALALEDLHELEHLYIDKVLTSRDGNEGIEAFIAKRKPAWEDA